MAQCTNFLEHALPDHLEEIPLEIRRNIISSVTPLPPHYAAIVRAHLDRVFRDWWIVRGGYLRWPPQSPKMNPLHYYAWEHLKARSVSILICTNYKNLFTHFAFFFIFSERSIPTNFEHKGGGGDVHPERRCHIIP